MCTYQPGMAESFSLLEIVSSTVTVALAPTTKGRPDSLPNGVKRDESWPIPPAHPLFPRRFHVSGRGGWLSVHVGRCRADRDPRRLGNGLHGNSYLGRCPETAAILVRQRRICLGGHHRPVPAGGSARWGRVHQYRRARPAGAATGRSARPVFSRRPDRFDIHRISRCPVSTRAAARRTAFRAERHLETRKTQ